MVNGVKEQNYISQDYKKYRSIRSQNYGMSKWVKSEQSNYWIY